MGSRSACPRAGALACLAALAAGSATAQTLEYPDVYKVPAVLAKGNADVAAGGETGALFTNPAGLAALPEGWSIAPLRLAAASSRHAGAFVRALGDALEIDDAVAQRAALVELVRDYRGRNLHGEAAVRPGVGWRRGDISVAATWLAAVKLDARTHQGFGERGLLELDARSLSGPLVGAAYTMGRLRLGAGVKRLRRHRLERTYSIRELVELTQQGRKIADERAADSDIAFDLGLQYALGPRSRWQPRLGVALQNIGGLDFDAAGEIPMTLTAGVSLRPVGPLSLNVEYFDLLQRLPQDDDHGKRVRLGGEWRMWDRPRGFLALRAGIYQGDYTAGVEWRAGWFRAGLATYAEERGAYPGQDRDRRYVLHLGIDL